MWDTQSPSGHHYFFKGLLQRIATPNRRLSGGGPENAVNIPPAPLPEGGSIVGEAEEHDNVRVVLWTAIVK